MTHPKKIQPLSPDVLQQVALENRNRPYTPFHSAITSFIRTLFHTRAVKFHTIPFCISLVLDVLWTTPSLWPLHAWGPQESHSFLIQGIWSDTESFPSFWLGLRPSALTEHWLPCVCKIWSPKSRRGKLRFRISGEMGALRYCFGVLDHGY